MINLFIRNYYHYQLTFDAAEMMQLHGKSCAAELLQPKRFLPSYSLLILLEKINTAFLSSIQLVITIPMPNTLVNLRRDQLKLSKDRIHLSSMKLKHGITSIRYYFFQLSVATLTFGFSVCLPAWSFKLPECNYTIAILCRSVRPERFFEIGRGRQLKFGTNDVYMTA